MDSNSNLKLGVKSKSQIVPVAPIGALDSSAKTDIALNSAKKQARKVKPNAKVIKILTNVKREVAKVEKILEEKPASKVVHGGQGMPKPPKSRNWTPTFWATIVLTLALVSVDASALGDRGRAKSKRWGKVVNNTISKAHQAQLITTTHSPITPTLFPPRLGDPLSQVADFINISKVEHFHHECSNITR